jgi:hypothetical protein
MPGNVVDDENEKSTGDEGDSEDNYKTCAK